MRRTPGLIRSLAPAILCLWIALSRVHAADTTAWRNRQLLPVERSGVTRVPLPPGTLDSAKPGLEDLRLLDPNGQETAYVIERAPTATRPSSKVPHGFRTTLIDGATEVRIETGTTEPCEGVLLATPAPAFMKAARVELSDDGERWTSVLSGAPLFRQYGAEQLKLTFPAKPASHIRVTIDDSRSRPVPVTTASLLLKPLITPPTTEPVAEARVSGREEFARETVLTIDLGARNIPIALLEFDTAEPLFTRKVTIATRTIRDDAAVEETLATGTIYRVAVDGIPQSAQLSVPVNTVVLARELFVHIENGDSAPLQIGGVSARQSPTSLVFSASVPGAHTLLSGNPGAGAPRYDVPAFAERLRSAPAQTATLGAVERNSDFRARDEFADAPLAGGPIDTSAWRLRREVRTPDDGVQQLELDLEALAGARHDLADLRLVRNGAQVPYLLERTRLSRTVSVPLVQSDEPTRPNISRWTIKLPRKAAPITQLNLDTSARVFERPVRVYENMSSQRDGFQKRTLGETQWTRANGAGAGARIPLSAPSGDTLFVEIDNGDNPPLTIAKAEVTYPVTRLLFKSGSGAVTLHYGNVGASQPRYDLRLVAKQLLAAERHAATLGPEQQVEPGPFAALAGHQAGLLFWGALTLVVVALLVVVAKLLPKKTPE